MYTKRERERERREGRRERGREREHTCIGMVQVLVHVCACLAFQTKTIPDFNNERVVRGVLSVFEPASVDIQCTILVCVCVCVYVCVCVCVCAYIN